MKTKLVAIDPAGGDVTVPRGDLRGIYLFVDHQVRYIELSAFHINDKSDIFMFMNSNFVDFMSYNSLSTCIYGL